MASTPSQQSTVSWPGFRRRRPAWSASIDSPGSADELLHTRLPREGVDKFPADPSGSSSVTDLLVARRKEIHPIEIVLRASISTTDLLPDSTARWRSSSLKEHSYGGEISRTKRHFDAVSHCPLCILPPEDSHNPSPGANLSVPVVRERHDGTTIANDLPQVDGKHPPFWKILPVLRPRRSRLRPS